MSEQEKFLTRWSRRKRVAEEPEQLAPAAEAAPEMPAKEDEPLPAPAAGITKPPVPAFDPASLPSLDSIGAQTDITAFLKPGVPGDLKLAALRRAWMADPAIRDFKGMAEYDWDFTVPNATMGFGEIDPGVDIKKMLADVFGDTPRAKEPAPELPTLAEQPAPPSQELPTEPPPSSEISEPLQIEMVQREENTAVQNIDEQAAEPQTKRRRSQGSALPQ